MWGPRPRRLTVLRNTLGNADDQGNLGGNGLLDTCSGHGGTITTNVSVHVSTPNTLLANGCRGQSTRDIRRADLVLRDEDGGGGGASLFHGIGNVGKDGETEVGRAGLLGVGATDNLRAYDSGEGLSDRGRMGCASGLMGCGSRNTVVDSLLGMETTSLSLSVVFLAPRLCGRAPASLLTSGETGMNEVADQPRVLPCVYSRSLLAGEALEEDLGLAVDAQVVDGASVGVRVRGAVCPPGDITQGATQAKLSRECLHLELGAGRWRGVQEEKKK